MTRGKVGAGREPEPIRLAVEAPDRRVECRDASAHESVTARAELGPAVRRLADLKDDGQALPRACPRSYPRRDS